jgi:hypothetical protein
VPPFRPVDLPELRREMAHWADSAYAESWWHGFNEERRSRPRSPDEPEPPERHGLAGAVIAEADLFYVEADMTELAKHASESFPDFTLTPEDLPSDYGVLYSPEPLWRFDRDAVHGVAWGPLHPDLWEISGIGVVYLLHRDDMIVADGITDPTQQAWIRQSLPQLHIRGGMSVWEYGDPALEDLEDIKRRGLPTSPAMIVKAAWVLMQQEGLARESEVELDRMSKKRLRRNGGDPEAKVRLITLRRPTKPASERGMSERDYQHQWVVRGHWRQQWYPSRNVHRPIWITPHIKGPEGAPLLGGERVFHWKQ